MLTKGLVIAAEPVQRLAMAVLVKSKLPIVLGSRFLRPNSKKHAALHRRVAMPELLYCAACIVALKLKYGIGDAVRHVLLMCSAWGK